MAINNDLNTAVEGSNKCKKIYSSWEYNPFLMYKLPFCKLQTYFTDSTIKQVDLFLNHVNFI